MKKNLLLVLLFLIFSFNSYASISNYFTYVDPAVNSNYVNRETNIMLNPAAELQRQSIFTPGAVKLNGTVSGPHSYTIIESRSSSVIILKPDVPFANGEKVFVSFTSKLKSVNGNSVIPFSYSFNVRNTDATYEPLLGLVNELTSEQIDNIKNGWNSEQFLPPINVTFSDNPAPGCLFLSNIVFNVNIPNQNHILILENDATPVFARQMPQRIFDFNKQPNGNLTYFDQAKGKYYGMNPSYTVIDSFYTGNGYFTDLHELRVLPNGHALLMSYDKQIIDMSQYISGGNPNANVTGLIIQEIDVNKNVVFQWRSWDHFLITDATHENLLAAEIDYVHGNAIEMDTDGNILISSRHMDEITKINRTTGEIIWRLGGKHNQFIFTNDPVKFSYQHGIRRLPNGNLILFDNGNYHTPNPYSRAVEYSMNESNHTVTIEWQYRNTPDYYGFAMGFAQRLSNGNTLISWGSTNPTLTEVRPNGSKTLEMTFSPNVFSYRVFKYDWNMVSVDPDPAGLPKSFSLSQNFPNPFNPNTKISFSIPASSDVSLVIYDAIGRVIETIAKGTYAAGKYSVDFNASNFTSGIYFYSIKAGDYTETKKMILVK